MYESSILVFGFRSRISPEVIPTPVRSLPEESKPKDSNLDGETLAPKLSLGRLTQRQAWF